MNIFKGSRLLLLGVSGALALGGCADDTAEVNDNLARLIDADNAIPGQYIVVFKDQAGQKSAQQSMQSVSKHKSSRVKNTFTVINGYVAELSPEALEEVRADPSVAYVERDAVVQASTVHSTDADGLDRIDARAPSFDGQYNDFGRDGAGVDAYVVDTGIRATHSEFTGRVGNGFSAINDGRGTEDCNGHGTHVASTVGGTRFGVAKAVTLHGVRVLDCQGSGSNSGVIAGVDFVREDCLANDRICVANMSLGGGLSTALNAAVRNAVDAGIPFVVAAGNENQDACNVSPSSEPTAITVAANADNDTRASFSNFGECVDIFAPGVSILGADIANDNDTQTISGTSMASPHVAGAAALIRGTDPGLSPAQVLGAMRGSANVNCISDTKGSPNELLFVDFGAGQFDCTGGGGGGGGEEASCQGRCDDPFDAGQACQCDDQCAQFGDCCADLDAACNAEPDPLSCVESNVCGQFNPQRPCQCDSACSQFGDCCSDQPAC